MGIAGEVHPACGYIIPTAGLTSGPMTGRELVKRMFRLDAIPSLTPEVKARGAKLKKFFLCRLTSVGLHRVRHTSV